MMAGAVGMLALGLLPAPLAGQKAAAAVKSLRWWAAGAAKIQTAYLAAGSHRCRIALRSTAVMWPVGAAMPSFAHM